MKRLLFLILIILISSKIFGQDNLETIDDIFTSTARGYNGYKKTLTELFQLKQSKFEGEVIVTPGIMDDFEYSLSIRSDSSKFFLNYKIAKESIWKAMWKQDSVFSNRMRLTDKPTNNIEIQSKSIEIPKALYEVLNHLFYASIKKAANYDTTPSETCDGYVYFYFARDISDFWSVVKGGQAVCPEKGTNVGELTQITETLRSFFKSKVSSDDFNLLIDKCKDLLKKIE